jgi:hypothetical protein
MVGKTQTETSESNSTKHKGKHVSPFVIQPTQVLNKFMCISEATWNHLIFQFVFRADGFICFIL